VTFDEDATFMKSKKSHTEEEVREEEPEARRIVEIKTKPMRENEDTPEEYILEEHDEMEPQEPVELSPEKVNQKRRPAWAQEIIQDAEKHGAPDGSFRESKRPKPYSNYVALLCNLVDAEPTCFEDATKKEWNDAMTEEYQSIMKNNVWEVVLRPKEKVVVSSKWIFKTKHTTDGSIEKYKARFVARGFSKK